MPDILSTFGTRATPQTRQADPRQTKNHAGGYTFQVSNLERLRRFLTIGTDAGTYYVSPRDLTAANAQVVVDMARTDHATLLSTILDVSERGAAPKQNPTLFALAIACSTGTDEERRDALAALPRVARTGTHLFLFARYIEQFRGWGRGLRRAVGNWYTSKDADSLAYQVVKYRSRESWTHRDLLRLSHPDAADPALRSVLAWITQQATDEHTPLLIEGFLKSQETGADVPSLVRDYGLSWEMLPDESLADTATWDALLGRGMPQTALMRQLPRLTRLGMLPNIGGRTNEIAARLADSERLQKARVHPVNALVAQRTYASGESARGSSAWEPSRKIVDALDSAFYNAFAAVNPSGKRTLLALDVSGSMTAPIANMPLSAREASAALALVQMATEPDVEVVGFTSSAERQRGFGFFGWGGEPALTPLPLSPRQRLDDAIRSVSDLPFGGTDCSLPARWAMENGHDFDSIVIYTDSETYAGPQHAHQAITQYRQAVGHDVKQVVVGMTATSATIADPSDTSSLDVAGFDSAVPQLITDFSRGL